MLVLVVGSEGSLGKIFVQAALGKGNNVIPFMAPDTKDATHILDLSSISQIEIALDQIELSNLTSACLVFCSGVFDGASNPENSPSWLEKSLQINLLGPMQMSIGFIKRCLIKSVSPRVVFVGSAAASTGSKDIAYGTSKAGIVGLIRSLSKSYANKGASVLGISPGLFPSGMSSTQSNERKQRAIASTHIERQIEIEEVLAALLFAVFEAPNAMTGSMISVSGGQL